MATNNNNPLVTYLFNKDGVLQFRAEGKRARIVFKRGTNLPADGFKKFIKSNLDAELPDNFGYVLNTSTNRYVKSTELYDKRFKVQKFRKAYVDKTLLNGRLRAKGDIVYSNTITYTDYVIDGRNDVSETTRSETLNTSSRLTLLRDFYTGSTNKLIDDYALDIIWRLVPNPEWKDFTVDTYVKHADIPLRPKVRETTNMHIQRLVLLEDMSSDQAERQVLEKRKQLENSVTSVLDAPNWSNCRRHTTSIVSTPIERSSVELASLRMWNASTTLLNDKFSKKFKDTGNMACVPETLHYLFCNPDSLEMSNKKRALKLSIDDVVSDMLLGSLLSSACVDPPIAWKKLKMLKKAPSKMLSTDVSAEIAQLQQDTRISGFTTLDIKRFCVKHQIIMYAVDAREKVFTHHFPKSPKKQFKALVFMVSQGHMWLYEDKAFAKKCNHQVQETATSCNLIIKKQLTEESQQAKIITDDDIIMDTDDLTRTLGDYWKDTKILPQTCVINNSQIKSFVKADGTRIFANPDAKQVKEYIEIYNAGAWKRRGEEEELTFNNQSILTFGRMLFTKLYPNHKKSIMNAQVRQLMKVNAGIVEKYRNATVDDLVNLVAADINRCRVSSMRDNDRKYIRVTAIDEYRPYDPKNTHPLKTGFYIVNTENRFPLRGNGSYSGYLLDIMHANHIKFEIIAQMVTHSTYPADYLKPLVDELGKYPNNKLMGNGIIGSFAKTKSSKSDFVFETDFNAANHYFFNTWEEEVYGSDKYTNLANEGKKQKIINQDGSTHKETFIRTLVTETVVCPAEEPEPVDEPHIPDWVLDENDMMVDQAIPKPKPKQLPRLLDFPKSKEPTEYEKAVLWSIESREYTYDIESDVPLFNQILENEWLKVYYLRKKMKGELVECKTDCVVCTKTQDDFVEWSTEMGGYKEDKPRPVRFTPQPTQAPMKPLTTKGWDVITEDDYSDVCTRCCECVAKCRCRFFDIAENAIGSGKSLRVEAEGGFGKTELLKTFQKVCDDKGLKYASLAPTCAAAKLINGQTIHSFLGLDEDNKVSPKMMAKMKSHDAVLIDEDSMVGATLMSYIQMAKIHNPKLRIYMFGDIEHQLPPVGEEDFDYDNSYLLKWLCDFNMLKMTINKRSDDTMLKLSRQAFATGTVDVADFGDFAVEDAKRHLCFTNHKRKALNEKRMKTVSKNKKYLRIDMTEDDREHNQYAQGVRLIVGTPLMSVKKYKKCDIVNNEEFVVTGWDDSTVHIQRAAGPRSLYTEKVRSDIVHKFAPRMNVKQFLAEHTLAAMLDYYSNQPIEAIEKVINDSRARNDNDNRVRELALTELISVKQTPENLTITKETFHRQYVVSYAMTIHKSQGQTFNFPYTIHERDHVLFSNRMLYVAITRTTNKNLISFHD